MRIWNLTPHVMYYDDGHVQRAYPSDGVLRVVQVDEPADSIDGLNTIRTEYTDVEGMPEKIAAGDVLLVSTIVADAFLKSPERVAGFTLLVPDTGKSCKRDAEGRIVSVCRFIRRFG